MLHYIITATVLHYNNELSSIRVIVRVFSGIFFFNFHKTANGQCKTFNNKTMIHIGSCILHVFCMFYFAFFFSIHGEHFQVLSPHPSVLLAQAAKQLSLLSSHEANG